MAIKMEQLELKSQNDIDRIKSQYFILIFGVNNRLCSEEKYLK